MSQDSQEYKKLRSIWYRKLRKKGFKDIEGHLSHHPTSPANSWYFQQLYSPQQLEEHARYFQLAGQFLHEHPFSSKSDKEVWRLHASGSTVRDIEAALGIPRSTVHDTITRLAAFIVKR